jgi:NDP-sugar pyrophosphorylase family protein
MATAARIRHALIMAAGQGVRMRPLTDSLPKALAPYRGGALIDVGLGRVREAVERVHVTVGYKGALLAAHVIERGVTSVLNTDGHGNAWWIYHTLMATLDEPVYVLTCDNLTEIDFAAVEADYAAADAPPCMIVPVRPVEGVAGDFITHDEERVVTSLDRERPSGLYASGIQVVNPARVNALCPGGDNFYDVWRPLIERRLLRVSRVQPRAWFSVDTVADLERLG